MIQYPVSPDSSDWAAIWKVVSGDFSQAKLAINAVYDLEGWALGNFIGAPTPGPVVGYDAKAHVQAMAEGRHMAFPSVDWGKLVAFLIQIATLILPYLKPTPVPTP